MLQIKDDATVLLQVDVLVNEPWAFTNNRGKKVHSLVCMRSMVRFPRD